MAQHMEKRTYTASVYAATSVQLHRSEGDKVRIIPNTLKQATTPSSRRSLGNSFRQEYRDSASAQGLAMPDVVDHVEMLTYAEYAYAAIHVQRRTVSGGGELTHNFEHLQGSCDALLEAAR